MEQYADALVQSNLIQQDDEGNLISSAPNTEEHNQLYVLATPVKQSLERYYMTLVFNSLSVVQAIFQQTS